MWGCSVSEPVHIREVLPLVLADIERRMREGNIRLPAPSEIGPPRASRASVARVVGAVGDYLEGPGETKPAGGSE